MRRAVRGLGHRRAVRGRRGLGSMRRSVNVVGGVDDPSEAPTRQNAPWLPPMTHDSSGPTHPHHQVRWVAEADRPPSGRLPPPFRKCHHPPFSPGLLRFRTSPDGSPLRETGESRPDPRAPCEPPRHFRASADHPRSRPHIPRWHLRAPTVPPPPPPPTRKRAARMPALERRDSTPFPTTPPWRNPNLARRSPPS